MLLIITQRYKFIVLYKTAFYSFYLPVALAFYLHGEKDAQLLEEAKSILLPLGEFFQVQDDYLDCFGDPNVIGKIGTDIRDKKCSWLLLKALEVASESQKKELHSIYGYLEQESRVKEIYKELRISEIFKKHEAEQEVFINSLIQGGKSKYQGLYLNFTKKIFGRQK